VIEKRHDPLQGLQTAVIALSINLIIIDSIAALVRADFGPQDIPQRQKLLGQQASALKLLSESFQIPVLVTNQITTRFNDNSGGCDTSSLVPALGPMWAHAVNTRLTLSRKEGMPGVKPPVSCMSSNSGINVPNGLQGMFRKGYCIWQSLLWLPVLTCHTSSLREALSWMNNYVSHRSGDSRFEQS